jgi:hypothetical protein
MSDITGYQDDELPRSSSARPRAVMVTMRIEA